MEQMTQANEQQLEQKKITKKELSKAFWIYQLGCELSNSYERLQSLVFCASMIPAIKKLYADDEEQQKEALKRHLNFFNTEGTVGASIQGSAGWDWRFDYLGSINAVNHFHFYSNG